jgi:hypothetical protein
MVSFFSGLSRAALVLVLPSQNARCFKIVKCFLGLTLHTVSVSLFSRFTRYLNVLSFSTRQSGRTRAVQCGQTDAHEQDNNRNSLGNAPKMLQDSRKRSTVTCTFLPHFFAPCVSSTSLSGYEAHLFTKEKHVTSRNARVCF